MSTRIVDALSRIPRPPLALLAAALAVGCFGLALLIGWLTAGTKERLAHAQPLRSSVPAPLIPALGSAASLPAPPRARPRRTAPRPSQTPRLIIGSG